MHQAGRTKTFTVHISILANANPRRVWGLFWIDVSDVTAAEQEFKKIADQIRPGGSHQTLEDALSVLAEVDLNTNPWLLFLDNADELKVDYARFFPSVPGGSILMTSRNHECAVHETVGCRQLETLSLEVSVLLLFKAARLPPRDWDSYRPQAKTITNILSSHTLAMIQAGAFISQDVRNWDTYPKVFEENREYLLENSADQAQSRYGNVYATFEVSARALEFDGRTKTKDALCLLGIFAMFHHSGFPTSVFEDASRGFDYAKEFGYNNRIHHISTNLAKLLPEFLSDRRASTLRLQAGLSCLEALSFIKQASTDDPDGVKLVSMHPLAHAWAKDRLDQRLQEQAWMMTGSIIAHSAKSDPQYTFYFDGSNWELRVRQLQSHISSFSDNSVASDRWLIEHIQVDHVVAFILRKFQLYQKLEHFLLGVFKMLEADPSTLEDINLLPLYNELALVWRYLGNHQSSLDLLHQITSLQEANSFPEIQLVESKHRLAVAYLASGATGAAVIQLKSVVSLRQRIHSDDDPRLLTSQHELGYAYLENGQVNEAIEMLEPVVRIRQRGLAESSPDRLSSEHELGRAYCMVDRNQALQLLEHVATIPKLTLSPGHPNRLATLSSLPDLYIGNNQPEKAKEVVVEFDNVLSSLPKDDARWSKYGNWLASWKQEFGMGNGPQSGSESST